MDPRHLTRLINSIPAPPPRPRRIERTVVLPRPEPFYWGPLPRDVPRRDEHQLVYTNWFGVDNAEAAESVVPTFTVEPEVDMDTLTLRVNEIFQARMAEYRERRRWHSPDRRD